MATDNSLGGLYMSLGLNLSELETDFIAAEKTTRENLARLNRESNLIKLHAEVEIGKLDATTDAVQILTVKETALNQQIAIQRDKIKLTEATLASLTAKHGESAVVTQRQAAALERERLALQRLESELRNVNQAQNNFNLNQAKSQTSGSFLDKYTNLKGDVAGSLGKISTAFNSIKDASSSADGAMTKSLEIIDSIPHPVGKAVAALVAFPLVMQGVENSLIDIAKPAIAAGDAFYVMSRGMQMSIKDVAQLSMICKVTGIDINEVNSAMRRFSTQLNKAGTSDNAMLKMLKRYGAELRDSNGKIKNAIELAGELGKALKKAQAEGNGAAFRDVVGGKFWSGDFVTFLEDFTDNVEQAKKVVKNGLADPVRAHALQGELNTLEAQSAQLSSAFSSAFMPIAEVLIPKTTQRMGELTKIIQDNADGIKTLGEGAAGVLLSLENVATKIGGALISTAGGLGSLFTYKENAIIDRNKLDTEIKSAKDLMEKELQRSYTATERAAIENNPILYQQLAAKFETYYKAIEEARKKTQVSWADFRKDSEEGIKSATQATEEELEASAKRIEKYAEELTKVNLDLKFGKDDYGKALAELDLWNEKSLQQAEKFEDEKTKITELYNAKREQIERQQAEKIKKIQEDTESRQYALTASVASTHSVYEKQLYDIKKWEEKSIEALKKVGENEEELTAIRENAAIKRAEAIQKEVDRIKGLTQSLEDEIFEMENSRYEADKRRAMQKAGKALKDGVDNATVQRWLNDKLAALSKQAREDKSGSYTKSPTGGGMQIIDFTKSSSLTGGNNYFVDFTKPNVPRNDIALFTDENKIRGRLNVQLADSTQKVITAQDLLADSTLRNADIEIIEGDKIIQSFNRTSQEIIDAEKKLSDATKNSAEEIKYWKEQVPDLTRKIFETMASGHVQQVNGGFVADEGYGANISNFMQSLTVLGLSNEQAYSYLDRINTSVQQLRETTVQSNSPSQGQPNINVAPNINVDLGGAYVFDDAMKQQLTDDVTNKIVTEVTNAVQQATSTANYGYGN